MSEILSSYNESIEEETDQESVLEVLFVAVLRDPSMVPLLRLDN